MLKPGSYTANESARENGCERCIFWNSLLVWPSIPLLNKSGESHQARVFAPATQAASGVRIDVQRQ